MKVESLYHTGFTVSDISSEGASTAPSETSPTVAPAQPALGVDRSTLAVGQRQAAPATQGNGP